MKRQFQWMVPFLLLLVMVAPAHALTPTEVAKLLASDAASYDIFGYSVAVDGDTILIGAYGNDDSGSGSGSAYVFVRDASGVWSQQAKLLAADGAPGDLFGWSVAVASDTVVIGARLEDGNGTTNPK